MAKLLPLLHKQERLLIAEELRRASEGDSQSTAQFAIAFAVEGLIDRVALSRALNAAVARHEALRTAIVWSSRYDATFRRMQLKTFARTGLFVPGLYEQRAVPCAEVELFERAWSDDPEELTALSREECAKCLDLGMVPALQALVIAGRHKGVVIINLSHLVVDLWAVTLLRSEVAHAYGAFSAGLPWKAPEVMQHCELVHAEIEMLQSREGEQHLAYWKAHYEAIDDAIVRASELPFLLRTRRKSTYNTIRMSLSQGDAEHVSHACGGAPDYAFWRTMYAIALSILVEKTRLAFTVNFLNRRRPGAPSALAWCAHPHLMAIDMPWSSQWSDIWRQVRSGVRRAQLHESLSWDTVIQRLGRTVGNTNAFLTFDVIPGLAPYNDTPMRPVPVPGVVPMADLSVRVHYVNRNYALVATFNSGRYDKVGVNRLVMLLYDTIQACAERSAATVGEIVRDVRSRQRLRSVDPVVD